MFSPDLHCEKNLSIVGFLARGHPFPKGCLPEVVFERLVELADHPFFCYGGYHTCDLGWCVLRVPWRSQPRPTLRYKGRLLALGATDIFVPGDGVVYHAPTLILHYIRHHKYLPPSCFVDAVLSCPIPGSFEHAAAIRSIAPWLRFTTYAASGPRSKRTPTGPVSDQRPPARPSSS